MKKFSKEQLDKIINNSFKAGTQNNLYYLSEETFRQMKKDKRFVQTYKVRTDIANEMLNLIDKSVWHNKNAKVLQLAGMSDDFFSLMFSRFYFGLASEIPDRYERAQYILDNNIYILCLDLVNQLYTQTECYCEPVSDSNIFKFGTYKIENNRLIEVPCDDVLGNINLDQVMLSLIDGGLKVEDMKFDAVVGNPPYNNDMYIDFVNLGFKLLKDTGIEVMITPAKWQAKGGEKNEQFRKEIVPHMKEIVYYPYVFDAFNIGETGGVCYYYTDKDTHTIKNIKNKCSIIDGQCFNSGANREIGETLNNWLYEFWDSRKYNRMILDNYSQTKRFKVIVTKLMNGGVLSPTMNVFNPLRINDELEKKYVQDKDHNYQVKFSSDILDEAKSFRSYMNTKFIRFIVACSLVGNLIINQETWRFVPDPGKFDHIFTDAELYAKYNLTDEEIAVIESVIKERK